jgi:hypothetical protein
MSEKRKLKLDISMNLYLKDGYITAYEARFNAESFEEAREMLDKVEKMMAIEYDKEKYDESK